MGDIFDEITRPRDIFDDISANATALKTPQNAPQSTQLATPAAQPQDIFDQIQPDQRRTEGDEAAQVAERGRGFFSELQNSLKRGGLNVVSGLGGTAEEFARLADKPVINQLGAIGGLIARKSRDKLKDPELTPSKILAATGDKRISLLIAQSVGEALPFMAGTVAATVLGGPIAGASIAFSVEGESAFQEALDRGESRDKANIDRVIVGTINAAIEKLQIDRVLAFGPGAAQAVKEVAKDKVLKKVAKLGSKLGIVAMKQFAIEGTQEAVQEAVSIGVPAVRRGEVPDIEEAARRIGTAGLGGGIAGVFLGGASAIQSTIGTEIQSELEQAEPVAEELPPVSDILKEEPTLTAEQQIAKEASEAFGEIKAKKPVAAKVEPAKPVEAKPEGVGKVEVTDEKLLLERRDIQQIPQGKRTLQQIERINTIEDELVKKHADEFPEIDISPKARNIETRKVRKQIKDHGIYQAELETAESVPDVSGEFNVDSTEIGDVKQRFEGRPEILKKFTLQEVGGSRWDQAAAELGITEFDKFMDAVEVFVEVGKTAAGGINEAALARALNSNDPSIELFALKHDMLKNEFTAAEINKEIQEFMQREDIDPESVKPELISLQEITDVDTKQAILRELDKTIRKIKKTEISKRPEFDQKREAIRRAEIVAAKTNQPAFVVEQKGKFTVTKNEPKRGEFTKITPAAPGEVKVKTEKLRAGPTDAQIKEAKLLKQRINIAQKKKGLTGREFSDLKMKHGGSRRLAGSRPRTVEQLTAVLKAVERARPKIVGHKKVVSIKTEKQITELRDNLTNLGFMNDAEFQKVLDIEVRGKEAKFIDAKKFITQKEANQILARMHDTAQRLRVTEPISRAVEKNPDIKTEIEKIEKLPKKAKDPSRLKSMRFFFQRLGEQATQPIYDVFLDLTLEEQARSRFRHKSMKLAEKLPDFAKIANDTKALQRVEDWIVSQSLLEGRPKPPADITDNEIRLAKLIQASFKSYETLARAGKMFEFFDNRTEMPQYLKFKQGIDKAFDVFNTKGYDALIKYLDTQNWGIVSAGYSPMESVVKKVSTNRMPDIAVGKGRIRQRGIAYRKQDRDILQRWYSYMRQMDQLIHIQPRIKSLVRLINDNQDAFVNPGKVNSAISTYLDNLKHTNYEDGLVEEWMRRLYSQAITVRVLADPVKPLRNLAQNLAFSEDRRDFFNLRNKKLTAEDLEYLETFVQQDAVMMTDWAFVGEDPLLFKNLTKWVQRKTLYPSSDRMNRLISFHAKINRVRRAFAKDQPLAKQMKDARFSDMQNTEQRTALEILAKDGVDAMARYVAKVHTDNTHFLYAREQRSPAEQTKVGKIALNLALFRRAALEKALFQLGKVFQRGTGFGAKRRAASVLVTLLGMSALTGVLWKRLTGQNYSPYSYFSFLELNFGGLEVATVEKVEDVYNDMLDIASSPGTKEAGKAVDKFVTSLTKASDLLIPFYDIGWRAVEATLGTENIDRRLGKIMREAIDKEFKSRGLRKIDRTLIEKIQFTFARGRAGKKDETEQPKIIFE